MKTTDKATALATLLSVEADEVTVNTYDDCLFEAEGEEWLVLTDEEADDIAERSIRETVWAFNADFVAAYVPDGIGADTIKAIAGDRCEDANEPILALIEAGSGFEAFADDAMVADGRGHFMSTYDGEEVEAGEFFLYRVN